MSAAIGGRSVNIGSAPDRSAAQTTQAVKTDEQRFRKEFNKLSEEEKQLVISGGKFDKVQVGATPESLFARSEFFQGIANNFIEAPSGANVDRRQAAARVAQLDQVIAEAKAANEQNAADRQRLEESGLQIFSGSPLDLAFSNKTHQFNSIIARATAEKQGIGLQTDTNVRKALFDNFKVITDKRGGTGRNRGVFDVSGRGGLSKSQAEVIQRQELTVADLDTAKSNKDKIIENLTRRRTIRVGKANQDGHSGARIQRGIAQADLEGNRVFTQRIDNRPDAEFFTDQLLSNDLTKTTIINSPEFAEFNKAEIEAAKAKGDPIQAEFAKEVPFQNILGRPVSFQNRLSHNKKSGTNSRGISDLERQQFHNTKAAELAAARAEEKDLSTLQESPIVKVADNKSIPFNRQASLFEALQTLNRIQGLPQFSGKHGSFDTVGKARLGALTKVQNQRLSEQAKEGSRLAVKKNFESELLKIQSQDLNQKDKKAAIFKLARERDAALKGKTVTNTQFEQSRAGFAASRTNIVSGATVKSVQQLIDEGRNRRRRQGGLQNA